MIEQNQFQIETNLSGALLCCQPLALLALRRVWRLALHPATSAEICN
jgi:hypothetical protein